MGGEACQPALLEIVLQRRGLGEPVGLSALLAVMDRIKAGMGGQIGAIGMAAVETDNLPPAAQPFPQPGGFDQGVRADPGAPAAAPVPGQRIPMAARQAGPLTGQPSQRNQRASSFALQKSTPVAEQAARWEQGGSDQPDPVTPVCHFLAPGSAWMQRARAQASWAQQPALAQQPAMQTPKPEIQGRGGRGQGLLMAMLGANGLKSSAELGR